MDGDRDRAGRARDPFLVRLKDILVAFTTLGFVSFGGPQAHIAMLHKAFVENRRWIGEQPFANLLGLGSALPGPTSSQMVAAIGYIHANVIGGLLALLCFQLPGALVLGAAGISMKNPDVANFLNQPPQWFVGFKQGIWAGAIVLIGLAVWKLGQKSANTKLTQAIATAMESTWTLPLFLAASGVFSYGFLRVFPPGNAPPPAQPNKEKDEDSDGEDTGLSKSQGGGYQTFSPAEEPRKKEEEEFTQQDRIVGSIFIVATFAIFVLLEILAWGVFPNSLIVRLAEIFYRVGFLIYGGGQVVLPLMLVELVNPGLLTEDDFLYGYALVQVLPGPLFNFSAFLGAVIDGWLSMILCWVCIFGPGVLLILGVYPFWAKLASKQWMQQVLVGVNAGALGLIVQAFLVLWVRIPLIFNSCAVFAFCLAGFFDLNTPLVIGTSGLLGLFINLIF